MGARSGSGLRFGAAWATGWLVASVIAAQDWNVSGDVRVEQDWHARRDFADVAAGGGSVIGLSRSGDLVAWGRNDSGQCELPPLAPPCVGAAISCSHALLLRADGTVAGIGHDGQGQLHAPPLPSGLAYVAVAAGAEPPRGMHNGYGHSVLLRSDGAIFAVGDNRHGQCSVPVNAGAIQIAASARNGAAVYADGSLRVWGDNLHSQCVVTPPPSGVRYVGVALGDRHAVAWRSDGAVLAFGDNSGGQGQIVVPASEAVSAVAAGSDFSVVMTAAGRLLVFGDPRGLLAKAPQAVADRGCKAIAAGERHLAVLCRDGGVEVFGDDSWLQASPCAMPDGVRIDSIAVGGGPDPAALAAGTIEPSRHALLVCSDGKARARGGNRHGQCDVPNKASRCVAAAAGRAHSLLLYDDGSLRAFGADGLGQCRMPQVAAGVAVVQVAAGADHSVAVCSDGACVAFGAAAHGRCSVPPLPAGMSYLQAAAGARHSALLRSDGAIVTFGDDSLGQCAVPPLPPGRRFVAVAAGAEHTLGRLDDGSWLGWGNGMRGQLCAPTAAAGTSLLAAGANEACSGYLGSDGVLRLMGGRRLPWSDPWAPSIQPAPAGAGLRHGAFAFGPGCLCVAMQSWSFLPYGEGCPSSAGLARLSCAAPPRLGKTMTGSVGPLPQGEAVLLLSLDNVQSAAGALPIELSRAGMPGCWLRVGVDRAIKLRGAGATADFALAIPNDEALLGMAFHLQGLVLDRAAGNAAFAALSDAVCVTLGG